MICQFCKDESETSRITPNGSVWGSSGTQGYYDEQGEWVDPTQRFWIIDGYRCSRGHSWTVRRENGVPDVLTLTPSVAA